MKTDRPVSKKPYVKPTLAKYGDMRQITAGPYAHSGNDNPLAGKSHA
jgi:hypothetical protein